MPDPAFEAVCDPAGAPRLVLLDRINDPQNLSVVLLTAPARMLGAEGTEPRPIDATQAPVPLTPACARRWWIAVPAHFAV